MPCDPSVSPHNVIPRPCYRRLHIVTWTWLMGSRNVTQSPNEYGYFPWRSINMLPKMQQCLTILHIASLTSNMLRRLVRVNQLGTGCNEIVLMRRMCLLQLPGRSFMHHWSGSEASCDCGLWAHSASLLSAPCSQVFIPLVKCTHKHRWNFDFRYSFQRLQLCRLILISYMIIKCN